MDVLSETFPEYMRMSQKFETGLTVIVELSVSKQEMTKSFKL